MLMPICCPLDTVAWGGRITHYLAPVRPLFLALTKEEVCGISHDLMFHFRSK
jgi:hypothetical protein